MINLDFYHIFKLSAYYKSKKIKDLLLSSLNDLKKQIETLRHRMADAALAAGRSPDSISIIAVSKFHPPQSVIEAFKCNLSSFGENYVQEGVKKIEALADLRSDLQWHCIGPVQRNKAKSVAQHFDWLSSLHSFELAQKLNQARSESSLPPLNICIQVNIDQAATKSGLSAREATALAHAFEQWPHLRLRGLMCIPDATPTLQEQNKVFAQARALFEKWNNLGLKVDTLSMGMSHDLEAAIAQGSTQIRIGTAIFGPRQSPLRSTVQAQS